MWEIDARCDLFARLSPRLALRVNNLERLWEELVDGVFYTQIWSANGNVMLYLSNGSRDQKQAKVLIVPKRLSKMAWWTVPCRRDLKNVGYSKSKNPLELLFSLKWRQPGNISSYSFPRMLQVSINLNSSLKVWLIRSRFVGDSAIDQWPPSSEHKTIPDLIIGPKDLSANIRTSIFT